MVIDFTREQLEGIQLSLVLRTNEQLSPAEREALQTALAKVTWALNEHQLPDSMKPGAKDAPL